MKAMSLMLLLVASTWLGCQTSQTPTEILTRDVFTWGIALDGYPLTPERLAAIKSEIGIPAKRIVFFMLWPERGNEPGIFPLETLNAIHTEGALPCLTWEPMFLKGEGEVAISAQSILAGKYDVFITAFAKAAAQWKKPLLIRFAHEMNLSRYHWGGTDVAYGPNSPDLYKQMFRYIVTQFDKQKAHNVLWAFCPNAESVPQATWNTISAYYPGDDVVDCLGVDGYNWGTTQTREKQGWNSRWQTFGEIFLPAIIELRALSPIKPLLVFETASVAQDGRQDEWLTNAVQTAKALNVDGLTWFHTNKENDWRLQPESSRALQQVLQITK
jgi:hypothetical protein